METKSEKFVRLGESRVNDVIKKLRLISNLSNTNNYDYTDEQVKEMLDTIQREVNNMKVAFQKDSNEQDDSFFFKNKYS